MGVTRYHGPMGHPKATEVRAVILGVMLILLLVCASPARAQSDADACQYGEGCSSGGTVTELDPRRFVDPVVKGSDALSGALSGEPTSAGAPSATSASRPDIEVLPDTGGAPIPALAGGAGLIVAALVARRITR